MPNYYNPYNFYPQSYLNQGYGGNIYPQIGQQSSASIMPTSNGPKMMEWVEGEVGAKAFQMPNGWPANSPIPLWDSTDTVIYLKSWGPMGIPNPMQKLKYELPEQQNQALLSGGNSGMQNGNSGNEHQNNPDMSQYVTKQDLEEIKRDLIKAVSSQNNGNSGNGQNNQNGSNNGQSRGGNR